MGKPSTEVFCFCFARVSCWQFNNIINISAIKVRKIMNSCDWFCILEPVSKAQQLTGITVDSLVNGFYFTYEKVITAMKIFFPFAMITNSTVDKCPPDTSTSY